MKQLLRWVLIVSIVLLGTCCMTGPPRIPWHALSSAELQQAATIALIATQEAKDGVQVSPRCSGVWVSRDEFITASHCVEPEIDEMAYILGLVEIKVDPVGVEYDFLVPTDIADVKDHDAAKVKKTTIRHARVTAYDKSVDLALLRVEDPNYIPRNHPIAVVRQGRIDIGEHISVVGHTVGYWWTYAEGVIAGDKPVEPPKDLGPDPFHVLQVSAPVWVGNSGGGVFDDNGELLGISSFIDGRAPNLSFFIHRDSVMRFLIKHGVIED